MVNQVQLSPEIVRMAQQRIRSTKLSLADELARVIVEEAVVQLDPELDLMLEYDQAFSQNGALVRLLDLNDINVNGVHIDVRAVDSDGCISVSRALIGTSYLSAGTVAVYVSAPGQGQIVGYVAGKTWQEADKVAGNEFRTYVKIAPVSDLDAQMVINGIVSQHQSARPYPATNADNVEIARFVNNRQEMSLTEQRSLVASMLGDSQIGAKLDQISRLWSDGTLARILRAGSTWNSRVEKVVRKVAPSFAKLAQDEIRQVVLKTGEAYGGQPEAPAFRKALLSELSRMELVKSFKSAEAKKMSAVVDQILSGQSVIDVVKGLVKNKVAVDVAVAIKEKRQKVTGFVAATAEEIGLAFQKLSVQPAYATHSQEPQAGVAAINEALKMLEAADLADKVKKLEDELATIAS